jgi:hypothetical protein
LFGEPAASGGSEVERFDFADEAYLRGAIASQGVEVDEGANS